MEAFFAQRLARLRRGARVARGHRRNGHLLPLVDFWRARLTAASRRSSTPSAATSSRALPRARRRGPHRDHHLRRDPRLSPAPRPRREHPAPARGRPVRAPPALRPRARGLLAAGVRLPAARALAAVAHRPARRHSARHRGASRRRRVPLLLRRLAPRGRGPPARHSTATPAGIRAAAAPREPGLGDRASLAVRAYRWRARGRRTSRAVSGIRARRCRSGAASRGIRATAPTSSSTRCAGPAASSSGVSPATASTSAASSPTTPRPRSARPASHADHFAGLLADIAAGERQRPRRRHRGTVRHRAVRPLVVRGPGFLGVGLSRARPEHARRPAGHGVPPSRRAPGEPPSACPAGSWGANGDFSMWLERRTPPGPGSGSGRWKSVLGRRAAALAQPAARPVLAQAARELLLAQSSDWQFIISTGAAADYAERRFSEHCDDAAELLAALGAGREGTACLGPSSGPRSSAGATTSSPTSLPASPLRSAALALSSSAEPWLPSASSSAFTCINRSAISTTSSRSTWRTSTGRCSTGSPSRGFLPVVLHLSGPLLEWLEQHEPAYLDRLGTPGADGKVELLLAGFYEPVLASLPRADRVEQIRWMREAVQRRFGVDARGSLAHRAGVGARARRRSGGRRRPLRPGGRPPLPRHRIHRRPAPRAVLDRERRAAACALPDRRAAPLPDSVPAAGRDRGVPAGAARRRATGSRCSPTTARSSAAGPARRSGSTSAAGSIGSCATIGGLVEAG